MSYLPLISLQEYRFRGPSSSHKGNDDTQNIGIKTFPDHLVLDAKFDKNEGKVTYITAPNTFWGNIKWLFCRNQNAIEKATLAALNHKYDLIDNSIIDNSLTYLSSTGKISATKYTKLKHLDNTYKHAQFTLSEKSYKDLESKAKNITPVDLNLKESDATDRSSFTSSDSDSRGSLMSVTRFISQEENYHTPSLSYEGKSAEEKIEEAIGLWQKALTIAKAASDTQHKEDKQKWTQRGEDATNAIHALRATLS